MKIGNCHNLGLRSKHLIFRVDEPGRFTSTPVANRLPNLNALCNRQRVRLAKNESALSQRDFRVAETGYGWSVPSFATRFRATHSLPTALTECGQHAEYLAFS